MREGNKFLKSNMQIINIKSVRMLHGHINMVLPLTNLLVACIRGPLRDGQFTDLTSYSYIAIGLLVVPAWVNCSAK